MPTLYLIQQNTILRKRGKRFLLCRRPPASRRYTAVLQKDILRDIPANNIQQVMLFGNIQVTTSALHLLLEKEVELAIFSYSGRLLGQLTPPAGKNILLRRAQFEKMNDSEFALKTSRAIVAAKIQSSISLLRQYRWNHPDVFAPADLKPLTRLVTSVTAVDSLKSLRGLEGAAAAAYFSLFGKMLLPSWQFSGRNKRPPKDPVNAVLSFGYVVAGAQIQSLLDGGGLDPFMGCYHQSDYGRASLALDLVEEFRHPFIDRLALRLFNKNIVTEKDFVHHPSGAVYLNTEGKKKFFVQYENMSGDISPDPTDDDFQPGGYLSIFQRQLRRLVNAINGEGDYQPYVYE